MRRVEPRDDSGVTLIELIVSMTIMAVVMTIFTSAALQMYRAANKTESLSNAQSELNNVFLRVDRIVRYASGISAVQQSGDKYYIGLLTAEAVGPRCYALQLIGGNVRQLQIATWNDASRPAQPPWQTIANNVVAPSNGKPFTVVEADAVQNFDRLQLDLVAAVGSADSSSTKTNTSVRFTALNTSLTTSSVTACIHFWRP